MNKLTKTEHLSVLSQEVTEKILKKHKTLRNQCGEAAAALRKLAKKAGYKLELVGGLYQEGSEHNWCVDPETGDIYDPTAAQFTNGINGLQSDHTKLRYMKMDNALIEECISMAVKHGWHSRFTEGISQIVVGYNLLKKERNTGLSLENFFVKMGIDIRGAEINYSSLLWQRGDHARGNFNPTFKKDVKGRLLVAQNYVGFLEWKANTNTEDLDFYKRFKPKSKSGIIQVNVLRSNSKRGGWLIRVHKQTPVLSQKARKFTFSNAWEGYWATDNMLSGALVAKAKNGKFGSAQFMNDLGLPYEDILNNINLLKSEEVK